LIVDVTWDSQLNGFPVNIDWDGKSDMELAVVAEQIIEKDSDPREFEKTKLKEYSAEEREIRKRFYAFFDSVLDAARR
jgi:hypothetical protein